MAAEDATAWVGALSPEDRKRRAAQLRLAAKAGALFLVFLLVSVESVGFAEQALVGLVFLCAGLYLGLRLVGGAMKKDWAVAKASALCAVALCASLAISQEIRSYNARVGADAAEPVLDALEAFHSRHGAYPEALGELVPRYLPSLEALPVTLLRTARPSYTRPGTFITRGHRDPSAFILRIGEARYDSREQDWRMGT